MRRFDKIKNIEKANILAEQRYLESNSLVRENENMGIALTILRLIKAVITKGSDVPAEGLCEAKAFESTKVEWCNPVFRNGNFEIYGGDFEIIIDGIRYILDMVWDVNVTTLTRPVSAKLTGHPDTWHAEEGEEIEYDVSLQKATLKKDADVEANDFGDVTKLMYDTDLDNVLNEMFKSHFYSEDIVDEVFAYYSDDSY